MNYSIRIRGQIGPQWCRWFDDLAISYDENGDTLLTGPVADQAALFGLLRRVRDVGLPLLSITLLAPPQDDPATVDRP